MEKSLNIRLGFAETDITPHEPSLCDLVGFDRPDNKAKGVLHRLKAQALVWENDKQNCCLIAIDSIGFTVELTNILRDNVAAKLNANRENIMVCFSHTHSAPDAAADNSAYFRFAQQKILSAIDEACNTLNPVKAVWGNAENKIGVNRRQGSADMDNRLGVLKIADAMTNETKILLLRVTAHANVLISDNYMISSDYIGTARDLLEKKYHCKVMLTQGASGNIRSKYRQHNADLLDENPLEAALIPLDEKARQSLYHESIAALDKNAQEIADAVDKIIDQLVPASIYELMMFSDRQTFFADVPTIDRALRIAEEAKKEADIDGAEWIKEVKRLHENHINCQTETKEIQYFVVNDGCFCGVTDEPMCEIALDIKNKTADDFIYFGGYTNGYTGYLPSAKEYDKGGYEVLWSNLMYFKYYDRVMPLNRETASQLADTVSQRWLSIKENKKH